MVMSVNPGRRRSSFRLVVRTIAVLCMAFVAFLYTRIATTAEATHLDAMQSKLIALGRPMPTIVLGMGPGPTDPILDRADVAAELWRRGFVSSFITSGGQGRDETEPESTTLRDALVVRRVPLEAISEENASTSTRENLAFSRRLLPSSGPVLIVTHDFHAFRAAELARRQGYEPILVTTRGTRLKYRPLRMLREVAALVRTWLS